MAIKNIVFDYGGVLVDWNPHYLLREYFDTAEEIDAFLSEVKFFEWNYRNDAGMSFEESTAGMMAETSNKRYHEVISIIDDRWLDMLGGYYPDAVELVHSLKAQGYRVYGLSNWSGVKFRQIEKIYPCWDEFDGMVISGEVKMVKPNPEIYHHLLDTYSLDASECVFIDDCAPNIEAAERVGIKGILHSSVDQTRDRLHEILK